MKLDLDFLRVYGVVQRCSIWKLTVSNKGPLILLLSCFYLENQQNKFFFNKIMVKKSIVVQFPGNLRVKEDKKLLI
jgi:hypothetical protein